MKLILIEWQPAIRNCRTHVFTTGWVKTSKESYIELIQSCYVDGRTWCNRVTRIRRSQIVRQMPLESGDGEVGNW